MFKKVVESLKKATVKAALRQGKLLCPNCGAKAGKLPDEWEKLMQCGACGTKASLPEWAADKGGLSRGRADLPPATTKIRKESDGLGGAVWLIPASGKFGFLLVFGILWLGITVLISGGFIVIEGDGPDWVMIPFFATFYAVGIGLLYGGLRQKFMLHRVTVSGGGVTLRKEMFGKSSEKSLAPGSVKTVAQKEFYQQNYKPVYGIEIKGTGGKMRFGSVLTEEEKAWLVADIKETLFGREETKLNMAVPSHSSASGRKEVFSVPLPDPPKHAWIFGLVFTLMAIGFMCFGIFGMEGDPLPEKSEGVGYVFDLISSLFSSGFRGMWLLMTTVFAGLGICMLFTNFRAMGQDRRIEGSSAEISIRNYKRGLVMKDQSFPRSSVTGIRASISGNSNGTAMKRIELIVNDKAVKLGSWVDGGDADALVAEVRAALE